MQIYRTLRFLLVFFTTLNAHVYAAAALGEVPGEVKETPAAVIPTTSSFPDTLRFCKGIVEDNISWITGLQAYWREPEHVAEVKETIKAALVTEAVKGKPTTKELDSSVINITFMVEGYQKEKAEWEEVLLRLQGLEWEAEKDPEGLPIILKRILNEILEKIDDRKMDIKVLKCGRDHPELKYISHLFPGNEKNTQAQFDSLEAIFYRLLCFAEPEYQADYDATKFDFIGSGRGSRDDRLVDVGVKESMTKKENTWELVTCSGHFVTLPLDKKIVPLCREAYEENYKMVIGQLVVQFPSLFTINLRGIPKGKILKYVQNYVAAKRQYEKDECQHKKFQERKAKRNAKFLKASGSSEIKVNDGDSRAIEDILEEIGEGSSKDKPGRRPKKTAPPSAAPASTSAGGGEPVFDGACGGAGASAAACGGAGASAAACGGAGASALAPVPPPVKASDGRYGPKEDMGLREKILALAMRQSYGGIMPEREYAVRLKGTSLDERQKEMLANLLKINGDGRYGTLKAVNAYNWEGLIGLLKALGFTHTTNNKFIYDSVRQIGLHYLHYDEGRLNEKLVHIMFIQLANIGFDKAYLEGVLER